MNMQSLFTLLPFIVLVIGITRVYCTIKERSNVSNDKNATAALEGCPKGRPFFMPFRVAGTQEFFSHFVMYITDKPMLSMRY